MFKDYVHAWHIVNTIIQVEVAGFCYMGVLKESTLPGLM